MPTNITDVLTYTTPIVAPADGDAETGASVQNGMQGLANRTALANSVLNSTGVVLLRSGNSAAMTALVMSAGQAGQIFYRTNWGIYQYQNPASASVDNILVFTASGAASGQWIHESFNLINTNGGVAGLSNTGKIAQASVPYGVYGGPYYNAGPVLMTTASTSLVALTGSPAITLTGLSAGDIVELVTPAIYSCASNCQVIAMASENGGAYFPVTASVSRYLQPTAVGVDSAAPLSFIRTVATSGNYAIQFQGLTTNGANSLSVLLGCIYARVTRP